MKSTTLRKRGATRLGLGRDLDAVTVEEVEIAGIVVCGHYAYWRLDGVIVQQVRPAFAKRRSGEYTGDQYRRDVEDQIQEYIDKL